MSFDWPEVRLGDYIDSCLGKMLDKKKNKGTLQPYLGNSNVRWGNFDLNDLAQMKFEESEHERYSLESGDLVVCEGGEPGRCAIWEGEVEGMKIQKALHRVRPNQYLNNYYLYYWFLYAGKIGSLEPYFTGTTIKHLTGRALANLPIRIPPLDIQLQCVSVLCSLDKKISHNIKTNQTLEQMAQAIFKSWFVDFDPVKAKMNGEQPEGMDAATASLFPEKLVESELGLIPEGWPVDQVGKHIDVTKGKSYKSAELQESTTALVTLKSFKRGGGYRMDGLKEYTGKYKPQQVIEAGDLVMSLTDVTQAAEIVGKPALVIDAPQYDTLVASLDVAILRPKETDAKQYFYGLMSTYRFHRYAESFATGTTVLHLSPKGITTFEFACPSAELVKKYHEFAAPIFAKIEANILESQELAKLRDTLLPKLLSGEIELG
ncbi:restriction endonuclease subunit S [Vibrio parahaemolyticus]|nr:restriction endonuclease subunit S [Vibrio parahaemolyticus]EJC6922223.1 restriction endonuclease subunit S [Vibrio parahaemolyticus]EKL0053128.1 restriction endonuclease subunit S [Vibrio parahaemolyticus]EMD9682503.1 restriction endonuclease subunit S [Vibrio parahaemolyticus]